MGFKLKSGNTSAFKMMGSSPAKESNDPKAIKGKHYPDKATVQKLKKGPYAKGGQNAQLKTATAGIPELDKLKAKRVANTNAGKIIKFGEGSNIIAGKEDFAKAAKSKSKSKYPKNFNATGTSKAGKIAKVAKKVAGKAGKFLGGKALGIAGMLMATSSKADQPTKGKGKKEYEGGKIDFTKKK